MRITIIGTGYVGLVTGACFADMGNTVWCVDIDRDKIKALNSGTIPFYEPGLESVVRDNVKNRRLKFTSALAEAIVQSELCFIAVGTPMADDGSADLSYVLNAARQIGQSMAGYLCIVAKSTAPVGTARKVEAQIKAELNLRGADYEFDVVSNPEFLKEGNAVHDCMTPDRIIIGADTDRAVAILKELYTPFIKNTEKFLLMDIESAEMTKYTANAMLATKITFMNEIANICERVGADVNKVRIGIGSDSRIGYQFIYPGCGYGGSCFPKDVSALIHLAAEVGCDTKLLSAVDTVNAAQKHLLAEKVKKRFGADLSGYVFAVWGLSFKPNTDDMREAPSITIINDLIDAGAHVIAYDPQALDMAKERYFKGNDSITFVESKYDAVNGADGLILVTEWKEFRSPDFFEIKKQMRQSIVFDGRNQYDNIQMAKYGFEYYPVGVANEVPAELVVLDAQPMLETEPGAKGRRYHRIRGWNANQKLLLCR